VLLSADWVLPVEGEPIADGAVLVEDGRIAAVGRASELGEGWRFHDAAIIPGLVNAHSHLEYAVYAGFGDGQPFGPWLATHVARKDRLDYEHMVAIARRGVADLLRSGVTTVGDASFAGAAAVACAELGLRAIVYLEVFGLKRETAIAQWQLKHERVEPALSDRVRLGVSPHAPYTCADEVYRWALELELPVMTHLNESRNELDWLVRGEGPLATAVPQAFLVQPEGRTGIERLGRSGLLDPRVVAAHCVVLEPHEIEMLATADVAVAHCPRSNAFLGCGIAPLNELRAAGLRVGIGTDGVSSTPSADVFDEMRAAVAAARARTARADALAATDVLALATLGSARALGLGDEVGSLGVGKRADLAVVGLDSSPWLPWEDPAAAVVFGGTPDRVLLTVVDGEIRYRRGETQWQELTEDARRARARMLGSARA
jgi:5-methylthioadenosine/S-adenosylhomocysteine deaminase